MILTVFGATGPTGLLLCRQALAAGHDVRAVTRRPDPLPLPDDPRLTPVRADVTTGDGVADALAGADAALSTLGAPYQRHPVEVYSQGTRSIVEGLRQTATRRRLVVVSAGLAYPPPPMHPVADRLIFPLLRNVAGRTLYADMRRMEEYLQQCPDIDWTILRPGRLVNADTVSSYRLDPDFPSQGTTSRADLAAALLAEATTDPHVHRVLAPTTTR